MLTAWRNTWPSAAVIVIYFAVGIVPFWRLLPVISRRLFSDEHDFALFAWFVGWVPHALAHDLNPFFSNAMFAPTGINLAQNTAAPLLGLMAAPFTVVFGPVVSANLLLVLAMPVSATAAFIVLRKWQVWVPAAALGGLMYGFSPYIVSQGLGHPQLMFLPLPPFIALTVVSILRGQASARRLGIQLGLLVTAQYLIEPEVLVIVALLTMAAVACVSSSKSTSTSQMVRAAWRPVGIALAIVVVLLAYPVWMLIAGPQHFPGPTFSAVNPYHNDALNFVVPGPLQQVSLGMRSIGNHLIGLFAGNNPTEAGGYIGIPILVLATVLAFHSRRSPRMQLAVVLVIGSALFSLGPHLVVDQHVTQVPLPFLAMAHIPFLDNVLPSRISLGMDACLAAVFAFGLDDIRRAPVRDRREASARQRRSIAAAGVSLGVLLTTQLPQWPYPSTPARVLPARLRQAVPPAEPVAITYPFAVGSLSREPLIWQAASGYGFRLVGGYGAHKASANCPHLLQPNCDLVPELMSPSGLQQYLVCQAYVFCLYGQPPTDGPLLVAETRTTLLTYRIRLVIVDRSFSGSGPVMDLFTHAIGPPSLSVGNYSQWIIRRGSL